MSKKAAVPDAWDDDWTNQADESQTLSPQPQPEVKLSKAARRAQHVQQQKQLWDSAENPGRNLWLEAQGVVPLKQEFKTPVTLLSRKPQPMIARRGTADGSVNVDDGEDSEEEARKKREADFEQRQRKANIEREEKLRKYAEARQRIMGSSTPASPSAVSRENSQGRDNRGQRTRANHTYGNSTSQSASPLNQSPIRPVTSEPLLFDPNDMGRRLPRDALSPVQAQGQPTRQPRGPDTSGRGGFGFADRGGKTLA